MFGPGLEERTSAWESNKSKQPAISLWSLEQPIGRAQSVTWAKYNCLGIAREHTCCFQGATCSSKGEGADSGLSGCPEEVKCFCTCSKMTPSGANVVGATAERVSHRLLWTLNVLNLEESKEEDSFQCSPARRQLG